MARPSLFNHRKFARLTRTLKSQALAVGVLELLWNACYESCDDRIGTTDDIAFAIQWTDRRTNIAAALHDAGFIDEDEAHPGVYSVHHLWDHAPQYVLRRREREDKRESDGSTTRQRVNARRKKSSIDEPVASHEPATLQPQTSTPGTEQSRAEQSRAGHECARVETPVALGRRTSLVPGPNHNAAYQCEAFAVPRFLHERFRGRLANANDPDPEASLQAWYRRLRDAVAGRELSGNDVKFLTDEFDIWRKPDQPITLVGIRGKTDGNKAALAAFVRGDIA